jgi:inorganic triphosphatase YgiF
VVETELKLLVPPEAVRRLAAHPLLKGEARPRRARLHSVYYDTPALDLWRRGVALRVRREGGRWLQAVKGGGSARAGLHRRLEEEVELAGPAPDLARINDPELVKAFARAHLRDPLVPVFATELSRSRRLLALASGAQVEASVDCGVIRSGDRAEPVAELELELKAGDPGQLYTLALEVARDVPLSLENRSKAERGIALYRDKGEKPVKAQPAELTADLKVGEAFGRVMHASFGHLMANERGMLEGDDPEFLHQMRVALRRLRSALSVFAPSLPAPAIAPAAAELKWLAASLGPARDWDVFMTETLPPIEREFGAHGELQAFIERCRKLRRDANARARRAVRTRRYRRLMLSLAGWLASRGWLAEPAEAARYAALETPVTELAAQVLRQRYDRVRKRGRKVGKLSTAELHRLRIAIKKFRYATDFFSGLYEGKPVRESLKRLSRMQDILGAMNDAATVANLMAHGFSGAAGRRVLEAKGILLGWSRGRAETLKRELRSAWKEFRAAERFW